MAIPTHPRQVDQQLKKVRMLLLDVDGVLTDGRLMYVGEQEEIKVFHVRDGLGIKLLMSAGIRVGIVTARVSRALQRRCRELGIDLIFDGVKDKGAVLDTILKMHPDISPQAIAFVGDDLVDLPLMRRVGLPIAVADAEASVRETAGWATQSPGGHGAVREVAEAILTAQGRWDEIMRQFD